MLVTLEDWSIGVLEYWSIGGGGGGDGAAHQAMMSRVRLLSSPLVSSPSSTSPSTTIARFCWGKVCVAVGGCMAHMASYLASNIGR
jgi:hypothetical protein